MYFKIFVYVFRDFYMKKQPIFLTTCNLAINIRSCNWNTLLSDRCYPL